MSEDAWPEEIGMRGADFHIIAVRRGPDPSGKMRYAMLFEDGTPVLVQRVEYRRSRCGLTFQTPQGLMMFEFETGEGI